MLQLDDDRGRRFDIGQAVLHPQVGNPGVLPIGRGHIDDLHRRQVLEQSLAWQVLPVQLLLVADEDDPLGQFRSCFAGRCERRSPRRRRWPSDRRSRSCRGLRGRFPSCRRDRGCSRFARAAGRNDRNLAAGGQLVDELPGAVLGLVEQRPVERFVAHAQAVIDDDHRVQRLAVVELFLPTWRRRAERAPGRTDSTAAVRRTSRMMSRICRMRRLRCIASRRKSIAAHCTTR